MEAPNIKTIFMIDYGSYFSRESFRSLDDLYKWKEQEIFEFNSPDYHKNMTDENRLYWIKLYNSAKIIRQIIIEDEVKS